MAWRPVPIRNRIGILLAMVLSTTGYADQPDIRHGSLSGAPQNLSFEGGLTITGQHADDRRIRDELAGSLDLLVTLPMGSGIWTLYVEGSTTPGQFGVSSRLPEANADVGTALDGDGRGRLQVSEFHYGTPLGPGQLVIGLIDDTGFLDTSLVANDETTQFLGANFVNNPTIAFPDYALGTAWHWDATPDRPGLTLLVSNADGLAKNGGDYRKLFVFSPKGKGIFLGAEGYGYWGATIGRLGVWSNTADWVRLDGQDGTSVNWGVYGVIDGHLGPARWNLRLGWADPSVSEARDFQALALEYPLSSATVGIGFSRTGVSPDLPEGADRLQGELYARFELPYGVQITPDLQWIRNGGFDGSGSLHRRSVWVAGVRLGYRF